VASSLKYFSYCQEATGGAEVGRKQEKAEQRKKYKESFKKVKHGHGGRPLRKREEAALGR